MSNSAAAEEPPHKKGKTSSSPSSPLSSLPDEILLNCLARVSKSDYAALSIVSKDYRSLIASPELYDTRSQLGYTENHLYVCLLTPPDPTPRWFILHNRLLRPIPSFPSHPSEGSSVVTLDRKIYVIGGRINGKDTSDVLLLDCRTHTWRKLPSMRAARASFAAGVVDGKIYVYGGSLDLLDSPNWAEVFDPKTDTLQQIPDRTMRRQYYHDSVVVKEEKVYGVDVEDNTFYYSPSEGKWGIGITPSLEGNRRDWCLIDERLIFCIDRFGNLCWSETEQLDLPSETETEERTTFWKEVKGLWSLNETLSSSRMAQFDRNFEAMWESYKISIGKTKKLVDLFPGARVSSISGSNIVLFWDVIVENHLEIWCAEISMERRSCSSEGGTEICGNIVWSNAVMTVDSFVDHYKVLNSVSVNL